MEQKTSINPACLQQMFDSAANAKEKGQSQFFTPPEFGRLLADLLPNHRRTVVDLSCGKGHLLHACATPESVDLLGCDIDPVALKFLNLPKHSSQLSQSKITGDLTKLFPLLVDVRFQADCFVLNPPFGLHWYRRQLTTLSQSECPAVARSFSVRDGQCPAECIDSTIATLMIALDRCTVRGEGFLIANEATLQRLLFAPLAPYQELARHIWAHLTFTGNVMTGSTHGQWDNEFNTGVIYFARAHQDGPQYTRHFDSLPPELPGGLREHRHDADIYLPYHQHSDTGLEWAAARDEWERLNGRAEYPFNIWLDSAHHIHTHLSLYDDRNPRIPKGVAERLHSLNGKSPMQLVLQRATRKTLEEAVYGGIWRVEPALQTAVSQAVHEYHAQRAPLYPLPEVQRLGYLDELDFITCRRTLKRKSVWFQAGKDYPVETKTGTVTRKTMRPNLKGEMELVEYTGSELFFLLTDEQGVKQVFVEQRLINEDTDLSKAGLPDCEPISLEKLVEHFVIPEVADVATVNPAGYAASLAQLDQIATFCGITPRRFQREDISRATLHDGLIVAWDTGLGKTWFMFLWSLLKVGWSIRAGRIVPHQTVLLVAPADLHERITEEAAKCFRVDVIALDSQDTFQRLATVTPHVAGTPRSNAWILPPAFYITSYTQLAGNGVKQIPDGRKLNAREWLLLLGHTEEEVADCFSGGQIASDSAGYYQTLEVARNATTDEIVKAWRKLCRIYHPDVCELPSAEEKTKAINAAYEVLKDPAKRAAYDAMMREGRQEFTLLSELEPEEGELTPVRINLTYDELSPRQKEDVIAEFCRLKYSTYIRGLGAEKRGIRCVYSPSLADLTSNLFACMAVDEAVRLQGGDNTIIGAGMRQMDTRYHLSLTATPIKNRLQQIFYLAHTATGGKAEAHARFPYRGNDEDQSAFANTYLISERNLTKERQEKKRFCKLSPQVCNVHGLWKLFAPIVLRRRKKDIGEDIVAKRKEIIRVPMGTMQQQVYQYHLTATYRTEHGLPAPGAKLQALRTVAGDPTSHLLQPKPQSKEASPLPYVSSCSYTPKMAAALKLISQLVSEGEQVVVFSAFLDPLDTLSHRLNLAGVPHYKLDGRNKASQRGSQSLHFGKGRDSGIPVLLGGVESVAEGHNWPKASHVILIAYSWALDKMLQAVDRVYRLNSVKDVTVHCIICDGTVDRKLESLLDEKEDAAELVLDGRLMGENPQEVNLAELLTTALNEFNSDSQTIDEVTLERDEWPLVKQALAEAMHQWQAKVSLITPTAARRAAVSVPPTPAASTPARRPMPRWQRSSAAPAVCLPEPVIAPAGAESVAPTPSPVPEWKQRLWRRTYETCEIAPKR